MYNRGPKIDPWGSSQIISRLDGFIFAACTNCFIFQS